MKVICDRGALVESLNLVSGVVVARTPKPVLTCVKLSAQTDTGLTLAATDLEVALRYSTPRVEVTEPGEALVPADKLGQIVRESVDPTLNIETEQELIHIKGQDSHFKLMGYPVSDFPPVPQLISDADFEIAADELHRLVAQTVFATARENSRYAINGVLVDREGNKLAIVATDGHRLALAKGSCRGGKGKQSAIVPTKALQLLLRLFNGGEQTVKVQLLDNQIVFASEVAVLTSNLVEGNFPPYEDVIPKDNDKKATLNTGMLTSAVRRAALLTTEESKGVRLSFAKEVLTLTSRAPEMGEARIDVECPKYDGETIDVGFNPQYILDALKIVDEDEVTMEFKASNKPGVLKTGSNFLYVVMPVNLQ